MFGATNNCLEASNCSLQTSYPHVLIRAHLQEERHLWQYITDIVSVLTQVGVINVHVQIVRADPLTVPFVTVALRSTIFLSLFVIFGRFFIFLNLDVVDLFSRIIIVSLGTVVVVPTGRRFSKLFQQSKFLDSIIRENLRLPSLLF